MAIRVGDLLCGRYLLEATIGRGGMGEVFAATVVEDDPYNVNIVRGMEVAVKVVNRHVVDDLLMARLEREAQAARLIHSAYVPALLAVDRMPDEEKEGQEELFLVLELLHGQSFSQRLKSRGGFLRWEELKPLGDDVLSGLIDAHRAGIVHRDLKPGNIFLARQAPGDGGGSGERAMILDFGVCKLDGSDGEKLTVTGESLGTVSYMAPEQIRGASKVDERADLYSFAMVVFEALSGRLAHDASGQMAMLASKLERSARSIRDVATVPIPAGLEGLLRTCLARKPTDRPASAQELQRLWRSLGKPVVLPRVVASATLASQPSFPHVGALGTQTALTANTTHRLPSERWPARLRLRVFMAAGGLTAVLLLLGAVAVGRSPRGARASAGQASVPVSSQAVTRGEDISAAAKQAAVVPVVAASPLPHAIAEPAPEGATASSTFDASNASDGATAELDLDAVPPSTTSSASAHPHRSTHGKKRSKDGFMSVAPF